MGPAWALASVVRKSQVLVLCIFPDCCSGRFRTPERIKLGLKCGPVRLQSSTERTAIATAAGAAVVMGLWI